MHSNDSPENIAQARQKLYTWIFLITIVVYRSLSVNLSIYLLIPLDVFTKPGYILLVFFFTLRYLRTTKLEIQNQVSFCFLFYLYANYSKQIQVQNSLKKRSYDKKRMCKLSVITRSEFKFSVDGCIWGIMEQNSAPRVRTKINEKIQKQMKIRIFYFYPSRMKKFATALSS